MSIDFSGSDLAYVIPSALGGNYVRKTYDRDADPLGVIPECAVLAVLLDDGASQREIGKRIWVKVRGRTDDKRNGRYKIVEGWTAASENGIPFLGHINTHFICNDTAMGTPLGTHLEMGRMAYVLADGLRIRSVPSTGSRSTILGSLDAGDRVKVIGPPTCVSEIVNENTAKEKKLIMVWWQVILPRKRLPISWCSEGNLEEWLLAPV